MGKPFWQEFTFKILEACGIETPTKIPVSDVRINVFTSESRLPQIHVTFEPYEEGEFKSFTEIFQAVNWKNISGKIEASPDIQFLMQNIILQASPEDQQRLYEILYSLGCRINK